MNSPQPRRSQNSLNTFLGAYFNWLVIAMAVIFLAAGYLILIKPKYSRTLARVEENISRQEQLYVSQQRKLENTKNLIEAYKALNAMDAKRINTALPEEYPKEKLFGELEDMISQGGFKLTDVSLVSSAADKKDAADASRLGKIQISLAVSAVDYQGFKSLLRLLESDVRLFDISSLSFSPSAASANLVLDTYYFKTAK